jgi:hypothetical protein
MIPYVILMVIGNVIVAVGYERAWDWKVCLNTSPHLVRKSSRNPCYTGYRYDRLYLREYTGRGPGIYLLYIFYRFLQTCRGINLCRYYCQQECLGIWLLKIRYTVDYQEWLYSTHYDEYELDSSMVSYWDHFLVFWKDFRKWIQYSKVHSM